MQTEKTTGFTLVELLITVALAAVILSIAAPTISTVIKNQRLSSSLESFSRGLFLARSESIKSGDTVTICARASNTQCGTDWNNGFLVFRDAVFSSTETQASRDTGDEIIRVGRPFAEGIDLLARGYTVGANSSAFSANYLHYRPNGRSAWRAGTFYSCDDRGNVYAKALHISISGEIKLARYVAGDIAAAKQDIFGNDLTCT